MHRRSTPILPALALLAGLALPVSAAELVVAPGDVARRGDPVSIRVTGLAPGAEVRVQATQRYRGGLHRAWGLFVADAGGVADTGTAPKDGSWKGADATALFWSGDPLEAGAAGPGAEGPVLLEVLADGKALASRTLTLADALPGELAEVAVNEGGVVGTYVRPAAAKGALPTLVLLGGSDGEMAYVRDWARRFAARGYATLALAYFKEEGLPPILVRVPVETVARGRDWLARQQGADTSRLGVAGVSKGAELALLAGATYDWVDAVLAIVPSLYVYEGIAFTAADAGKSSWTLGGQEVPFLAYPAAEFRQTLSLYRTGPNPWWTPVHEKALALATPQARAAARIPVEKIQGKVFCAGGYEDTLWASGRMCDEIVRDLKAAGRAGDQALTFLFVGHALTSAGYTPVKADSVGRQTGGGHPAFNAAAQQQTWTASLAFLKATLGD